MMIRIMAESDLENVAKAHELAFTRQTLSKEWLTCTLVFKQCDLLLLRK